MDLSWSAQGFSNMYAIVYAYALNISPTYLHGHDTVKNRKKLVFLNIYMYCVLEN